ncbi:uncharacterized protein LOC101846613 isoform X2 [Aplysia californica]|uniref:Uncharacterized protein LOC101846613 isoform X2 n=1 Tax=Aplysia californica TaxID=6500 RepID=A0ABM0J9X4_APLCA|nr:uncharacterized protein LOC101846613 isoform X2 [Aplysia californica]
MITSLRRFAVIVWIVADLVRTQTTAAPSQKPKFDDNGDMTKGLAAGFGGFAGVLLLLCLLWCCCCTSDDKTSCGCFKKKTKTDKGGPGQRKRTTDKAKVGPSPPQSGNAWSRGR